MAKPYWDGSFVGNPALSPLVDKGPGDIVIVQNNPIARDKLPHDDERHPEPHQRDRLQHQLHARGQRDPATSVRPGRRRSASETWCMPPTCACT
jgi:predicted acylesterase/phospholipase RssA